MSNNPNSLLSLMVHSYKGGTGKTTIAVNLAKYFSSKQTHIEWAKKVENSQNNALQ